MYPGCVCLDNDFFRVTRSFRGKAGSYNFLFPSLFSGTVGIDQKYISPRYDSTECFFFGGGRVGRHNGVESPLFFPRATPRGCTKVVVYLLGGKGFRLPAEKSRPAKLMI